ncbi:hypothetical protein J8L70_12360 [Pseudoalteromonas sp. MMG010]|uniref:hypothetical protein n=1 Tax=Pseudoalteromonas sp. MMG010 TaxID=2822685 RepID=UPI001B3A49E7|nr:hypothetical protein [Pseudoalteromonas sp. MMG010]MBQ4834037.1 hypothetical protein [Pseudoalteromonas sp. MMG010]
MKVTTNHLKNPATVLILLLITMLYTTFAYSENTTPSNIIVVANIADKNKVLTKQQIRHIYMGGALSRQFKPVNLQVGNPIRVDFNTHIVGLTESRIQAYWAQMKFTGRSKPPIEFSNIDAVMSYILAEENAIAYVPADTKIPASLTVVKK